MRIKPVIDGRDFNTLKKEAIKIIEKRCPSWSDRTASDPGIVLLEAFAYLTDVMLYRLNQLPKSVYTEILKLFGVKRIPASTSEAIIEFSLSEVMTEDLIIPKHTALGVEGADDLQFITISETIIPAGELSIHTRVYNCKFIDGEIVGKGNGEPGNQFNLSSCPVISSSKDPLKIVVGVEVTDDSRNNIVINNDIKYEKWSEVDDITSSTIINKEFMVDYSNGEVMFPVLGISDILTPPGIPEKGKKICVSYYSGGGSSGNVAPKTITKIISEFPYSDKLSVINKFRSEGGADPEDLEVTLERAPGEINSQKRAITASDYETIARKINGIHRAKALTQKSIYSYGKAGTVSLFISPKKSVNLENKSEMDEKLQYVHDTIMERTILGTSCDVKWAKYKPVGVKTYLHCLPGFNKDDVRERVDQALSEEINSFCKGYGESIILADIYRTIMHCDGVDYINSVGFITNENPDSDVRDITPDYYMDKMWYASQDNTIYTTHNNGDSWEILRSLEDNVIYKLTPDCHNPGYLAFVSKVNKDSSTSTIHFSRDCGENIESIPLNILVTDLTWVKTKFETSLYITSHTGLFKMDIDNQEITEVAVQDGSNAGYYSIQSYPPDKETEYLIVLSRLKNGVYIAKGEELFESFNEIGCRGLDIRSLTIENDDLKTFLWFGQSAIADEEGDGCFRLELSDNISFRNSTQFKTGWIGGSCRGLAIEGETLWAGTHRSGLLSLNLKDLNSGWGHSTIHSNLPKRDIERVFTPVNEVSSDTNLKTLMVATENGLYRKDGSRFYRCSDRYKTKFICAPINYVFKSLGNTIKVYDHNE